MAVALIDYNMGNLGSVAKALTFAGAEVRVVADASELRSFDRCILPGVGNFGDGMENLRSRGFDKALPEFVAAGGRCLGICLGMQMMLESSEEAPGVAGLGIFPGGCAKFPVGSEKIPQIGWNSTEFVQGAPIAEGLGQEPFFYFVHSYYVPVNPAYTVAVSHYILPFSAVIGGGGWIAAQFHPEKSQKAGIRLLRNFLAFPAGARDGE